MQLLETLSESCPTAQECAASLVDVVPLVMRAIRAEMRSRRTENLSVPQFRALAHVDYHPGTSLSEVAEQVGLTLPSASKMVDGLVDRGLMARGDCAADRRRVTLALTERGRLALDSARRGAEAHLAEELDALSPVERTALVLAMSSLRQVFAPLSSHAPSQPR